MLYSLTSFGTEGDVLHGDPAIALDEGCLNVGDVNGGQALKGSGFSISGRVG